MTKLFLKLKRFFYALKLDFKCYFLDRDRKRFLKKIEALHKLTTEYKRAVKK